MERGIFNKALVVVFLMGLASPVLANTDMPIVSPTSETRVQHLQNRLEEIKAIDTKALSRVEKKALRKEVREIRKELAAISGGVYLSIGAIILIALLLILLL